MSRPSLFSAARVSLRATNDKGAGRPSDLSTKAAKQRIGSAAVTGQCVQREPAELLMALYFTALVWGFSQLWQNMQ